MKIGMRLKKLRHDKRWTQIELAEKIGVDQSTLSRWEHGSLPRGLYWKMLMEKLPLMERGR